MANNRIQYDLMFQSAKQCNGPDESMRDYISTLQARCAYIAPNVSICNLKVNNRIQLTQCNNMGEADLY